MPTRTTDPADVGTRIRVRRAGTVHHDGQPIELAGATGSITNVFGAAVHVYWDDDRLNLGGACLVAGLDSWETAE